MTDYMIKAIYREDIIGECFVTVEAETEAEARQKFLNGYYDYPGDCDPIKTKSFHIYADKDSDILSIESME